MGRLQIARILAAITIFGLLPAPVLAQRLPWRLGRLPGERVEIPRVQAVQGQWIDPRVPSVVIFAWFRGCEACEEQGLMIARVAERWHEAYPSLQVVLVDTRSSAEEVQAFVEEHGIEVPVVTDVDDAFENAFDTNRQPMIYFLDGDGVIQEKLMGAGYARLLAFDRVLRLAVENRWEEVREQGSRPLVVGERVSELPGLHLPKGRPVVILHMVQGCFPCQALAETGLQQTLNQLAADYPNADFVILEEAWTPEIAVEALSAFAQMFGMEALPESARALLEEEDPASAIGLADPLPEEGWGANIQLVKFVPGTPGDPALRWGELFVPGLIFIDPEGLFQGPRPFWQGPFDSQALAWDISAFLDQYR